MKIQPCSAALVLALLCAGSIILSAATITISNTADSGAGSLRAALAGAANGDTIDATGVTGTITLTSGQLIITTSLNINGPGPTNLAIDGNFPNTTNRVLLVMNGVTVSISGLAITNGHTIGDGGGILNRQSALTLSNCTLSGNFSDSAGGGVLSVGSPIGSATLTIINSI